MRPFNRITFIGIITLLLWVSYLPYLYPTPFQEHAGFKKLAKDAAELPEWLKEKGGFGAYSQSDFEKILDRVWKRSWFITLIIITVGIMAGILILKRKNSGRILAIGISSLILVFQTYSFIRSHNPLEHFKFLYLTILHLYPIRAIHNDIIAVIICIGTIIYLLRPSIVGEFKSRMA